jgi:hypothetical protein
VTIVFNDELKGWWSMLQIKGIVRALCVSAALLSVGGCRNSSGTLGKARLSVLNLVSVEGEGIAWDNRVPAAATATTQPVR